MKSNDQGRGLFPGMDVRKHFLAALLTLPAAWAGIAIRYFSPPLLDLFAYGGTGIFFYNLWALILTPYFLLFILAIGGWYISRLPAGSHRFLQRGDLILFSFFAGSGLLTLFGFLLGMLSLLYFWVCFPVFVIVLYIYFLQPSSRQTAGEIWEWVVARSALDTHRIAFISLRIVILVCVAVIVIAKGILLELFKDGGLHQYFGYFAETRLLHGIWMDASHPILFDYLAGRGQGVLLFITSFTNQYTIQIVGVIYLIAIAAVVRQVLALLLASYLPDRAQTRILGLLPDLGLLLSLTSFMLDMEPARFHLQTGAFFMFLAWAASMYLLHKEPRWLFFTLLPVVIAFPILGGIYLVFVGWILGMVIGALWLTKKSALIRYPLLLLGYGGISAAFSFGLNWWYVGIPDIQPARVFLPFIWMERFQHWSSEGLITYLYLTFNQTVSTSSLSVEKLGMNALTLFYYPLDVLTKRAGFPQSLLWFYPLTIVALFFLLMVRTFRKNNGTNEQIKTITALWLTFTSLYILRFLLTSVNQQGSLRRMLVFMDVFPIITFLGLILLLTRTSREMRMFGSNGRKKSYWLLTGKGRLPVWIFALLWGGSLCLAAVNLWSGFWSRPLPEKIIALVVINLTGAGLFYFFGKRTALFLDHESPQGARLAMKASQIGAALSLAVLLFSITPLSSYPLVPHTITIRALDIKNPASDSSNIRLVGLAIDGAKIPLKSLIPTGAWTREQGVLQSEGEASLTFSFSSGWDAQVEVILDTGPSAGNVQIEYDDQPPIVKDLYSASAGSLEYSPTPSPADNQTSLLFMALLFIAEFVLMLGFTGLLTNLLSPSRYSAYAILLTGFLLGYFQFNANFGFDKVAGGWRYFTGVEGAVRAYDPSNTYGVRSDIFHCLEILEIVPGSAQILNINGLGAVEPCLFSPLLPRDKIVQYYEAVVVTEPYYDTLMFGDPRSAYQLYRDLGINYFYLRKNDSLFVNLGYSMAFLPENLGRYFDILAEAEYFYILTWRGEGLYPVSPELESQIVVWYERSKQNLQPAWWPGFQALEGWYLDR